jgi:hypothetical protein
MKTLLSLAVAVIAISAPLALAEEATQEARPTPTLPSEADAKALVVTAARTFRDSLKDKNSAEFRSTYVMATVNRDGHQGYSLCGEIKTKRDGDAVADWHKFVAFGGDQPSATIEGPGLVEHLVPITCSRDRSKSSLPAVFGDHDYGKELQAAVQQAD